MHGTILVQMGKDASALEQSALAIIEKGSERSEHYSRHRAAKSEKPRENARIPAVVSKQIHKIDRACHGEKVLETAQHRKHDTTQEVISIIQQGKGEQQDS